MKRPTPPRKLRIGTIAPALVAFGLVLMSATPHAHAQCTALNAGECHQETHHPKDYAFTQSETFWMVVGVVPSQGDDKDIYLFDDCVTGWGLAGSTGISGTDFVVGDFNHNAPGTYYPQSLYGDTAAVYSVYWNEGGSIFPIGIPVEDVLGGSGEGCNLIRVWDVYLELGAEYRITWSPPPGIDANLALFRNPGTETYWAPRNDSEFEMSASGSTTYTALADDWYGLVVFPTWSMSSPGTFEITIEKLDDCVSLTADDCKSHVLYTPAAGPGNDFAFTQSGSNWAVVAVVPDSSDTKTLDVSTGCDADGTPLVSSFTAGAGETELAVGDFNHNAPGTHYARVAAGQSDLPFSIEFSSGAGFFSVPGDAAGVLEGCGAVTIWDVYLEAGKQYGIRFDGWGEKDPHAALFRNPGTSDFWGGRQDAEWEISGSVYHYYTAPQTDWYGLVVFANNQTESSGGYDLLIQEMGDCEPLTSGGCASYSGWPREFSFHQSDDYWAAVALSVSEGDSKVLSIMTQCDLLGSNLAQTPTDRTAIIVADFNHTPFGTYYPTVTGFDPSATYTIQCDTGTDPVEDIFPLDELVSGSVGGASGGCGLVRIWDLYLSGGTTYDIGFIRNYDADVRLALFRNPSNGAYWGANSDSEWELSETGNHTYTAPASDWYGLVAYSNTNYVPGEYTIRISEHGATGIEDGPSVPKRFALHQNAPNPFNPSTVIRYDVPAGGGHVDLRIYDVGGRLVRTLVDRTEAGGERRVTWDGRDDRGMQVTSGVYFCRFNAPGFSDTRKMILMK